MIEQRRVVGGDPLDVAVTALVAALPTALVVDVGGGSGTRAVPLAIKGCQVTVVDSSTDALAILHRRAQDAGVADLVAGVQADAELLASVVPSGGADLVLCHHLLEEVDDPAAVVAALATAVRPGGLVSVLVAGRLGAVLGQTLAGRFGDARAMLEDADGRYATTDPLRRRYDAAGISRLLTTAGLQVESVTGVGVLSGLVSAASRQALAGSDGDLAALEVVAAVHPALVEIAADLHVVARRPTPAPSRPPPGAAPTGTASAGAASGVIASSDAASATPRPETARPETARPETARPETARPETAPPEIAPASPEDADVPPG